MSEFCEIIIVSTSSKEYTDIIIQNINSDKCYINYTIYKEIYDDRNDIVDFSLINRDIKKCIFICHENNFFNAPKENIVKLNEFLGEEDDREILYLQVELMKLSANNVEDVTIIIRDIIQFIQNRRN
jgi:TFIIF-interacting CTD phosphatase-like protein